MSFWPRRGVGSMRGTRSSILESMKWTVQVRRAAITVRHHVHFSTVALKKKAWFWPVIFEMGWASRKKCHVRSCSDRRDRAMFGLGRDSSHGKTGKKTTAGASLQKEETACFCRKRACFCHIFKWPIETKKRSPRNAKGRRCRVSRRSAAHARRCRRLASLSSSRSRVISEFAILRRLIWLWLSTTLRVVLLLCAPPRCVVRVWEVAN